MNLIIWLPVMFFLGQSLLYSVRRSISILQNPPVAERAATFLERTLDTVVGTRLAEWSEFTFIPLLRNLVHAQGGMGRWACLSHALERKRGEFAHRMVATRLMARPIPCMPQGPHYPVLQIARPSLSPAHRPPLNSIP
jgi:hypothetical protein